MQASHSQATLSLQLSSHWQKGGVPGNMARHGACINSTLKTHRQRQQTSKFRSAAQACRCLFKAPFAAERRPVLGAPRAQGPDALVPKKTLRCRRRFGMWGGLVSWRRASLPRRRLRSRGADRCRPLQSHASLASCRIRNVAGVHRVSEHAFGLCGGIWQLLLAMVSLTPNATTHRICLDACTGSGMESASRFGSISVEGEG